MTLSLWFYTVVTLKPNVVQSETKTSYTAVFLPSPWAIWPDSMIAFQILLYINFPIYIISSQTVANVQTSVHHLVCDWITLKYKSINMPANQGDAVLRSKIALIAFTPDVSARLARIKHPPAILCRLACRLWRAKEGRKSIFNEIIRLKAYNKLLVIVKINTQGSMSYCTFYSRQWNAAKCMAV